MFFWTHRAQRRAWPLPSRMPAFEEGDEYEYAGATGVLQHP